MSESSTGLIIGGVIPAILFGISATCAKFAAQAGIGVAPYMMIVGSSGALAGGLLYFLMPDFSVSPRAGIFAVVVGVTWGLASGCIALALTKYHASISQLVPLFNTNTLIAVVLGLVLFSEWRDVEVVKLLIGSLLIVIGGILITAA